MARLVNKAELAAILGVSLTSLDRTIRRHPDLPIVRRGSVSEQWQFDAEAVVDWSGKLKRRPRPRADRKPGELTPAELLATVKLRRLEREEAERAGSLVEVDAMRAVLMTALGRLRRWQETTVRQVLRDDNVPEATIRSVEARMAEGQRQFVSDMRDALLGRPNASI